MGNPVKVVMSRFWVSPLKYEANLVVVDPVEKVKDTPRIKLKRVARIALEAMLIPVVGNLYPV